MRMGEIAADMTDHNRLHEATQARIDYRWSKPPAAGHNNPPGPLAQGIDATTELNDFLTGHPVITSHDDAKAAGGWLERTRISLKTMEDERVAKVKPFNDELNGINAAYRAVRTPLEKLFGELRKRLTDFARAEEAQRAAEAAAAHEEAEAAEAQARAAEAAEADAIADAEVGAEADVGMAVAEADVAFADFQHADRTATRADRESRVRIGSVMGNRALSMRTVEVLVVEDAIKAIKAIGVTDKIRDAILSSARDFRKAYDELPDGVSATQERSL